MLTIVITCGEQSSVYRRVWFSRLILEFFSKLTDFRKIFLIFNSLNFEGDLSKEILRALIHTSRNSHIKGLCENGILEI